MNGTNEPPVLPSSTALPGELQPIKISSGEFFYKLPDKVGWKRLWSPDNNSNYLKYNCDGITFDGGVILSQKDFKPGSMCFRKLILTSPAFEINHGQLILEAECVEVHKRHVSAYYGCEDKATAIAQARLLPLASLNPTLTAAKLVMDLSEIGSDGTRLLYNDQLCDQIRDQIERGYRPLAVAKAQQDGENRYRTTSPSPPPPPPGSLQVHEPKKMASRLLQLHTTQTEQHKLLLKQFSEYDQRAISQAVRKAIGQVFGPRLSGALAEKNSAWKSEDLAAMAETGRRHYQGLAERNALLDAVTVAITFEWEQNLTRALMNIGDELRRLWRGEWLNEGNF